MRSIELVERSEGIAQREFGERGREATVEGLVGVDDRQVTGAERVWRAFLRLHGELSTRMNRDLQHLADPSLADYDVLVKLSDTSDDRLRPFELGQALQWEQSRLSHHLARMQRRGLVARVHCPDDRRGAFIELTDAGRDRFDAAAPAHAASVRELMFADLDPSTLTTLEEFMTDVLRRLGPPT